VKEENIIIIGAGLAGISAAITIAKQGKSCILVSAQASERAQSVLAEGGVNAALNTKGENDSIEQHFEDSMKGGCYLADPNAVYGLTKNAPEIVKGLRKIGVPFALDGDEIDLRPFGGQKKRRTAYAKSSTGKMIMSAMIDEVRKYEAQNRVKRLSHHEFVELLTADTGDRKQSIGCKIQDVYTNQIQELYGSVILANGGLHGFFGDATTGTTQNTGDVAATIFRQGVEFGNLEMIQYHPTTIQILGKRLLVSEAARGEGGRLFVNRNGKPWYFMEELFPEVGNLAPRDVVSREMTLVTRREDCDKQIYLDMRGLSEKIWDEKLSDLREEIIHYLNLDPAKEPVPVEPGIHYFMGGILVDEKHRTNLTGLYAAGECACQYHGANRLGGNSMLGAIYGGKVAAEAFLEETDKKQKEDKTFFKETAKQQKGKKTSSEAPSTSDTESVAPRKSLLKKADKKIQTPLRKSLGIIREEAKLQEAIEELETAKKEDWSEIDRDRFQFALAILYSAQNRKESRGAHYRLDYPEKKEEFRKTTVAEYRDGVIKISFREIPKLREKRGACHGKEN
jgi:succinate dehydrogenase / fumarate reductase flavoprotein subunit